MGDEITKAELDAMIEVQSKSATQMEKVAGSLHTLAEGQKESAATLKTMGKDVTFIKWIVTSLAAVVSLGILLTKVVERFH